MPLDLHLIAVGKTRDAWLREGMAVYEKRLPRYARYRKTELTPGIRSGSRGGGSRAGKADPQAIKRKEGERILDAAGDAYLVLFDVGGKALDSPGFAEWLAARERANDRQLAFAIGGAWGFSEAVYARARARLTLSPMTFNHQIVRLVAVEQLYRAFSIQNGEPYHNA
jgi:23S rRNA (pseudouridine1915-N3)-methyltransferase